MIYQKTHSFQNIMSKQQMLRLENPDNVCYTNAGINVLLSSPYCQTTGQNSTEPINKPNRTLGYCDTDIDFNQDSR